MKKSVCSRGVSVSSRKSGKRGGRRHGTVLLQAQRGGAVEHVGAQVVPDRVEQVALLARNADERHVEDGGARRRAVGQIGRYRAREDGVAAGQPVVAGGRTVHGLAGTGAVGRLTRGGQHRDADQQNRKQKAGEPPAPPSPMRLAHRLSRPTSRSLRARPRGRDARLIRSDETLSPARCGRAVGDAVSGRATGRTLGGAALARDHGTPGRGHRRRRRVRTVGGGRGGKRSF